MRSAGTFADAKLQVWVLYHLQIIGETARTLSAEFRQLFPDSVWSNILVHHYFENNEELIRQIVEQDLPPFRETTQAALRQLESRKT